MSLTGDTSLTSKSRFGPPRGSDHMVPVLLGSPTMRALLATGLLLFGAAGCVANTPIKRTAFVPGARLPARAGSPLASGQLRLEGGIESAKVIDLAPIGLAFAGSSPGDPGVYLPHLLASASLYGALSDVVELGVHGRYASLGWASPNIPGVLPFPAGTAESLFEGGFGARLNLDPDGPGGTTVAAMLELNLAKIVQSVYVCADCPSDGVTPLGAPAPVYRFDRTSEMVALLPNLALQVGHDVADHVHVFGLLAFQQSYTNIGFDSDLSRLDQTTLSAYWILAPAIGVAFDLDGFGARCAVSYPLEAEARIDHGVDLSLQLAWRFGAEAGAGKGR